MNPYLGRPPRVVAGDIMVDSIKALQECKTQAQVRHALRTARKDLNHYFHPVEKEDNDGHLRLLRRQLKRQRDDFSRY